ncbi:MAG TPA: hypothetical protein VFR90_10655 [Methylibium sp.]|uniref:hypothetical protein n=1 Tax=Methylibium sp. TaxID=2067992 RepID=UPI002DBED8C4|nr:hypothetical protein [Methylibium sp.]HEU4459573.1 hypothetical protein [Methylibium sp.]
MGMNFPSVGSALGIQNAGGDTGQAAAEAGMGSIREMTLTQMRLQTEMGILQMIAKLNEALAKLFKALGDAIKNLA